MVLPKNIATWVENDTNEEEYGMVITKTIQFDGLLQGRLTFHGHTVRKCGNSLALSIACIGTYIILSKTAWLKANI